MTEGGSARRPPRHRFYSTQTSTVLCSASSSTSTILPSSPVVTAAVRLSQSTSVRFSSGENACAAFIPHLTNPIGILTLTAGRSERVVSTTLIRRYLAFWAVPTASVVSIAICDHLQAPGCHRRRARPRAVGVVARRTFVHAPVLGRDASRRS